jgi:hypothetical protein
MSSAVRPDPSRLMATDWRHVRPSSQGPSEERGTVGVGNKVDVGVFDIVDVGSGVNELVGEGVSVFVTVDVHNGGKFTSAWVVLSGRSLSREAQPKVSNERSRKDKASRLIGYLHQPTSSYKLTIAHAIEFFLCLSILVGFQMSARGSFRFMKDLKVNDRNSPPSLQ